MTTKRLVIVGDDSIAALAQSIAARTRGGDVSIQALPPDRIAATTLTFLSDAEPGDTEVFAAIGMSALNFARFDLWAKLRMMGYRCATLIDPNAAVDPSAVLADNVLVGAQATVGPGVKIGSGTIVHAGVHVGAHATLGKFGWLAQGVTIGASAKIGPHVVLGAGVHLADGAELGGSNEISVAGTYRGRIPYGTFIAPEFTTPVRLVRHA
jgi:UDP-3-O-[3-hydroxymyristoyl] glucosamine N-acyltransferase